MVPRVPGLERFHCNVVQVKGLSIVNNTHREHTIIEQLSLFVTDIVIIVRQLC